jgi:hypothetical protein
MLTGFFPLAIRPAGHDQRWTGPAFIPSSPRRPLPCHPGPAGIGPALAAVIVAEISDITRFAALARLCSRAALAPAPSRS